MDVAIGRAPPLTDGQMQGHLRREAHELVAEFREHNKQVRGVSACLGRLQGTLRPRLRTLLQGMPRIYSSRSQGSSGCILCSRSTKHISVGYRCFVMPSSRPLRLKVCCALLLAHCTWLRIPCCLDGDGAADLSSALHVDLIPCRSQACATEFKKSKASLFRFGP